ncbi:uncharacterized protein LOC127467795 [Manacus candei]|uniref:uncharacterized protein LOC127467795 n=1 Tax=Manacus candei TaxID=415023 RepID=UPI0022277158|nr:uncharacterized protein LOC127467795 [Manacus candei]
MVGRAGLCIAPSGCVELQELLVPPGPMDWTPQPLRSCPATGAVSSGGTASPAGEVGRAFAGLVGHIYSSGMEPGKCTELSPGIERDQAREVKKEGRREVRQQASSTKLLCKQESQESFALEGENLEIGKEEKKPRDSSLSPRQPMNCLAGNGGTGWTLHCSLGMCVGLVHLPISQEIYILKFQMLSLTLCWLEALPSGTAGTPGAAWADGLDAPAPPFLPGHWGRVQWWHCQPCSGMEPGKCTELSPGIERDQAREVKKEGRREVRQQASSTKLLCKQS